jgi:hypothetical protein
MLLRKIWEIVWINTQTQTNPHDSLSSHLTISWALSLSLSISVYTDGIPAPLRAQLATPSTPISDRARDGLCALVRRKPELYGLRYARILTLRIRDDETSSMTGTNRHAGNHCNKLPGFTDSKTQFRIENFIRYADYFFSKKLCCSAPLSSLPPMF